MGKQNQKPQHLNALGISMFRSAGFFDKNIYSSQLKKHYPGGHLLMVILPHTG